MRRPTGGLVGKALDKLEEATGQSVVHSDRLEMLEAYYDDYRVLQRQLEDIGWSVLDYVGNQPQEMAQPARRRIVQRARYVWMNDPQAGASVELMNDFCFGRGVPRPRCKDKKVQKVVDDAWDDPDNQEVLTTLEAQLALGTDLALQSNVFLLMFDDGQDGKVKLSILRHDDVTNAIPDPDRRHRALWYVVGAARRQVWDFATGMFKPSNVQDALGMKPTYYQHWRNVDLVKEEQIERDEELEMPEDSQVGKGKVYHARINRYSEQIFGVPRFQRTLRWYSAYNQYVKDRLDVVSAGAAIIMKRKMQGTPTQLARDATKAISRESPLSAAGLDADPTRQFGPRAASIVEENQSVTHEPFNLDTRAPNAQADAQIIRAPISAAERWTQAYYGDTSNSSLATATSLELPILKAVESRQEVFEGIFRWFIDRVIEKAVDDNLITDTLDPDEIEVPVTPDMPVYDPTMDPSQQPIMQALQEAIVYQETLGNKPVEAHRLKGKKDEVVILVTETEDGQTVLSLVEAHEDKTVDEQDTQRDLGYEFSMPSPLRRMMADLISSITSIAQTFDPNNTNPRLSRALLTIALGEGLEVQDAPDLVDEIIPEDYVDPMVKAQLQMGAQQQAGMSAPGDGTDPSMPGGPDGNVYAAPMNATRPEDMRARTGPYQAQQSELSATRRRDGRTLFWRRPRKDVPIVEHFDDMAEPTRREAEGKRDSVTEEFQKDIIDVAMASLDGEHLLVTDLDRKE